MLFRSAMVATGFVLFIFVLIINLLFQFVNRKRDDNKKTYRTGFFKNKSKIFAVFLKCLSYITSILSIVSLGIIVLYIFIKGLPNITSSMFAITGTYSGSPTILPSIISTLMLVFLSLIIAVPIGIGASIFLSEYTKSSNKLIKVIRIGIETLASIPSIIYGGDNLDSSKWDKRILGNLSVDERVKYFLVASIIASKI